MLSHQDLANALRILSVDMVEKANSGHPGMPLGMADIAEVLWHHFLKHNPGNPAWQNRDRFVLSNGHGSALLYSLLHLTGYDLSMDELKRFRQLNSKTPGHPERGLTPGVETTTGPLGQGLANAVGMAISEKILSAQFNRPSFPIIDHFTYVFVGDGCLMEGISHEACSLAGTLGLEKLIVFWDDNGISIDGKTEGWFTEDVPKRFESYGWHVIAGVDGHNAESIRQAITIAQKIPAKPKLICCQTTIGFGAGEKAGTAHVHGLPLGKDAVTVLRKNLNWPHPPFEIPESIYAAWNTKQKGAKAERSWNDLWKRYEKVYSDLANELQRRWRRELPSSWEKLNADYVKQLIARPEFVSTRKASLKALEALGPSLPELLGGSADLTGSNLTEWSKCRSFSKTQSDANYIHYGVREFGMSAIMNGMALHGGFIPYGGTFLIFHSYAANAVRMAALMKQRVIFVYSHDSIGLGEDGPTHQPIEQINTLRMTPNMSVWRPCDAVETAVAWRAAIERQDGPTSLLLSRQNLTPQFHDENSIENIRRGGYVLMDSERQSEVILIATGSEVNVAIQAAKMLKEKGQSIRVVSMPSTDVFFKQPKSYQEKVLPSSVQKRVVIEAGSDAYWYAFVGSRGRIIGLDHFGESARMEDLFTAFGFTVENVIKMINELI